MRFRSLLAGLGALVVGCTAMPAEPTTCLTDRDCPRDTYCIVGRCSAGQDASREPDGAPAEVGLDDASTLDAGTLDDASTLDAGTLDTGTPDAATLDTGSLDAAATDAGVGGTGSIVLLYTGPSSGAWTRLATAARGHPSLDVVAVINPDSGPAATFEPAYFDGIRMLHSAGVRVIGYIETGYGLRAEGDVVSDLDTYLTQYVELDGFFFDQAATYEVGHELYYGGLTARARGAGATLVVASPGAAPAASYAGIFDVSVSYGSMGAPAASTLVRFTSARSSTAIAAYGVAAFDVAYVDSVRPLVRYVYLTDDVLPNPWNALPTYLEELFATLD